MVPETIEIRPRKTLLIFVAVMFTGVLGTGVYVFLSKAYTQNNFAKILQFVLTVYFIYTITKTIKKLRRNEPAIVLSPEGIVLNDGNTVHTMKWRDVQDVSFSTDDSTTYLSVKSFYDERKVSINWLDKSRSQIENLIEGYQSRTASGQRFKAEEPTP